MVQAKFTISAEEFTEEIFEKIKSYLKGQSAAVKISIEAIPMEAPRKETRQEYFTKLDKSIAELERGEGVASSLKEYPSASSGLSGKRRCY